LALMLLVGSLEDPHTRHGHAAGRHARLIWDDHRVAAPEIDEYSSMNTTLVIEDGVIEPRVRRPYDLARALVMSVLTAAIGLLAYVATGTAAGIEIDLAEASALLPPVLILVVNVISGAGVLLLPVAAGIDLFVRRRGTQLAEALVGLLVTIVIATIIVGIVNASDNVRLLLALAGSVDPTRGSVNDPLLAGLVAFLVVARLLGRPRWGVAAIAVMVTTAFVTFLSGGITVAGILLSLTLGGATGFAVRYGFGIASTRPRGQQIVDALERMGLRVTVLQANRGTGRGRRYSAHTIDGRVLELSVFDRDLEGSGLLGALWRRLRLRDETGTGGRTIRETIERSALIAYAASAAGAPMPRLLAVTDIGPESAVLCYEHVYGQRFSECAPGTITDSDLDSAWQTLKALHAARIAHRDPSPDSLLRREDGVVHLLDTGRGVIAATELQMRLDVAEMLCSLAFVTSAESAVASARRVIGDATLTHALPAIQPFAFSAETQRALRSDRSLLKKVRSQVADIVPEGIEESVRVERLSWRMVFTVVLGSVAGYLLITQLTNVDLARLLTRADTTWVLIALGLSLMTYIAATMVYQAFVPERLNPLRTFTAQFAASFAALVTPSTVGVVATNIRYVNKSGVPGPLAAASVTLAQVFGVALHVSMLIVAGLAAGTARDLTFNPPRAAVITVVSIIIIALLLLPTPPVRQLIRRRIQPLAQQVLPRLVRVAQKPSNLALGVSGFLLLNASYALCLIASVRAFGGEITIAAGFFIFLAGQALGQAVPTPGGLGGVEAALAAGLTASGMDAATAISSVLLFRLLTFWLPTVPGWFAFRFLQSRDAL
jgi:glycosyltransferase 2 family protein